MKPLTLLLMLLFSICNSSWAEVVDLNPFIHVKGDGVTYNPFELTLKSGHYIIEPISGTYVAFSPWDMTSNCIPFCNGDNGQGFGHYYGMIINGEVIFDRSDTFDGFFYDDSTSALSNAVQGLSFSLTSEATVEFFIPTGAPLTDNRGGISLLVTAVPEASSAWLFFSGISLIIGYYFLTRKRHKTDSNLDGVAVLII